MDRDKQNRGTPENRPAIVLTIENRTKAIPIRFPCSESALEQARRAIAADAENPPKVYVKEVIEPKGFAALQGTEIDVDEMNYLSKRMESLSFAEVDKLYAIASQKSYIEPKDLINLTFNLDCYTLIQNLRDISAVGRNYLLTVNGGMTLEELSGKDLAKLGRELIESGKGIYTDYGLLIRNEEVNYQEVYDGQVFPEYWHRSHFLLGVELSYNEKKEYVYLPEEELAITKALARLNAPSREVCGYALTDFKSNDQSWKNKFKELLERESIFEVNQLLENIRSANWDLKKLSAVLEYAGAGSMSEPLKLSERLHDFEFLPEVDNAEEVGRYLIEHMICAQISRAEDCDAFEKGLKSNKEKRDNPKRKQTSCLNAAGGLVWCMSAPPIFLPLRAISKAHTLRGYLL